MGFPELDGNDAYTVLGVARNASAEEIRRAHRSLIKTHHPDRFDTPSTAREAEHRTRLINAAREILATRRADYDASLGAVTPAPRRRRPHFAFVLISLAIWAVVILVLLWFARESPAREEVPEALAGTWSGTLLSPGGGTLDLEITVRRGEERTDIHDRSGPCALRALPDRTEGAGIVLRPERRGSACDVGEIFLSPRGHGTLYVELRTSADPDRHIEPEIRAAGDLHRS